ncbi:MAG: hypothetical protein CL912_21065 [Deltaproteobacteria bacterium]|nr:hypothetical protein [Deltaproteobacteria bacterium]|tara:strand:+ start:770 stop:1099 length:330 start_codon:yes stop_codon:yes gene_type:complete
MAISHSTEATIKHRLNKVTEEHQHHPSTATPPTAVPLQTNTAQHPADTALLPLNNTAVQLQVNTALLPQLPTAVQLPNSTEHLVVFLLPHRFLKDGKHCGIQSEIAGRT